LGKDSFDRSLCVHNPHFSVEILDRSLGPHGSIRFGDGGSGHGESGVPFSLDISLGDL